MSLPDKKSPQPVVTTTGRRKVGEVDAATEWGLPPALVHLLFSWWGLIVSLRIRAVVNLDLCDIDHLLELRKELETGLRAFDGLFGRGASRGPKQYDIALGRIQR